MKRTILVPVFVCAAMLCVSSDLLAQRCGVERWAIKTGTDPGAVDVDLDHPRYSSIGDLVVLEPPRPIPPDRFPPVENTVFVVDARLTAYKFEGGATGDSDYHLVLEDGAGNTMVGEIPAPDCVGDGSPFAELVANARAQFDANLHATTRFQETDIPVQVTGVGFFDFFHNQRGVAPNVIELHPILNIVFPPESMKAPVLAKVGSWAR